MNSGRARGREDMDNEPRIEERAAQPYAGIRATTPPDDVPGVVARGCPELVAWLAARDVPPAGAPFIRFHVLGDELELELGVPLATPVAGEGRIAAGMLPAGRWLTLLHVGPFSGLEAGHDALKRWARERDVALAVRETDRGAAWAGCVERYLVDPREQPDSSKWETELAYLLR